MSIFSWLVVSSPESFISFERQCLDQYTSFLYTLSLFIATKVPDFSVEWDILQNDLRFAPKKPLRKMTPSHCLQHCLVFFRSLSTLIYNWCVCGGGGLEGVKLCLAGSKYTKDGQKSCIIPKFLTTLVILCTHDFVHYPAANLPTSVMSPLPPRCIAVPNTFSTL